MNIEHSSEGKIVFYNKIGGLTQQLTQQSITLKDHKIIE
jgi:hypothetical protein